MIIMSNILFINIIGYIHIITMLFKVLYGFIMFQNINYDKIYLLICFSLSLNRLLCKDECIISYAIKKYNNHNYKLGDIPNNYEDIFNIIPGGETTYNKYEWILTYVYVNSLNIVNMRTVQISYYIWYPTIFVFLLYSYKPRFAILYNIPQNDTSLRISNMQMFNLSYNKFYYYLYYIYLYLLLFSIFQIYNSFLEN